MVLYFFNLSNGQTIRDADGEECADASRSFIRQSVPSRKNFQRLREGDCAHKKFI